MVERNLDEQGFRLLIGYKGAVGPFLSKLFYDKCSCPHSCLATQVKTEKR